LKNTIGWKNDSYENVRPIDYERRNLEGDYYSIVNWAMICIGVTYSKNDVPTEIADIYIQQNRAKVAPSNVRNLFAQERVILALDATLARQRQLLRLKSDSAYNF
jgi:hypothetical protein